MERNHFWAGGSTSDKGHVLVKVPGHPQANAHGYVRLHRLVMEAKLGRPLLATEVVHHIDGNKQNNHPDNLMLFDKNSQHLRYELSGRRPRWTEGGKQQIAEGVRRGAVTRHNAMLRRLSEWLLGRGGSLSRETIYRYRRLATDPVVLSEIRALGLELPPHLQSS